MSTNKAAEQLIADIETSAELSTYPAQFVESATECMFLQGTAEQQHNILDAVLASPNWIKLVNYVAEKYNTETHAWLIKQVQAQRDSAAADAVVFRRIAMVQS